MIKKVDLDTRFYVDINIKSKSVIGWGDGSRFELKQKLTHPDQRRIFITKGQYNKLTGK